MSHSLKDNKIKNIYKNLESSVFSTINYSKTKPFIFTKQSNAE